jgi:hypothetical protein
MEFKIGTKFKPVGKKYQSVHTVVDIHTTRNFKGEIVKVRYVAEYEFCGQIVTDRDIVATTIARGLKIFGVTAPQQGDEK